MAIVQEVKDGKIVDPSASSNQTNSTSRNQKKEVNNELGKEQFLKLLVTQMQYQDPLEPTQNSEWVAQMATFSMVESLNDMKSAFQEQSAYDLVGKNVILNTGSDVDANYVRGKVDFITIQNGKTKLSVADKLYDVSTLDTVADDEYYEGSVQANTVHEMIALLPSEDNLSVSDDGLVRSAREEYDKLTDSQKQFVKEEDLEKLSTLEKRMDSLKATRFTNLVDKLPSVEEIGAAEEGMLESYGKKIAEATDYLENMSDAQKTKAGSDVVDKLHAAEDALKKAEEKYHPTQEPDKEVTNKDIAEILKQILQEVQGTKKEEDKKEETSEGVKEPNPEETTEGVKEPNPEETTGEVKPNPEETAEGTQETNQEEKSPEVEQTQGEG